MQKVQVHFEMLSISTQAHRHTGTSKMASAQTSKWNDVTWSYSSAQKKQTSPTLGPRFLVKFPRVGKAKKVNRRPVGSVGRELGFCAGGLGFNPPPRPTLRVFKIIEEKSAAFIMTSANR